MRRRAGSRWSARTGATSMRCGRRRCCCPSSAPPAPRFAPPKACPTPRRRSDIARAWIGRQHSLSATAIRKRAKANGWTRGLSGAVRSRVRVSLVREGVRADLLAGVTPSRHRRCGDARGRGGPLAPARHGCAAGDGGAAVRAQRPLPRGSHLPKACPTPRRRSDLARAWIGRQHSLSDTAIRKRAKANGWTRDLSGAVRSRFAKVGSRGRLCEPARRGNALRPPSSMRRRAGSRSGACPTSRRSGSIDPDVPGPSLWTSAWIFVSAPTSSSSGTAIVPVAGASLHMNFQE